MSVRRGKGVAAAVCALGLALVALAGLLYAGQPAPQEAAVHTGAYREEAGDTQAADARGGGEDAVQKDAPGVPLPVLMYHSVLSDPSRAGKYVVSPQQLEQDMKYLADNGYTTVCVADLLAYVNEGVPLPQKPVMLTFGDGYYNNLTYLLPLLEKYDMRAVISVVGSYAQQFTDTPDPNPNYAHLNWEDIHILADSGRVEIQNHSYDMHRLQPHRGSMRKTGESEAQYREALCADVGKLQSELTQKCGMTPTAFAYPFGSISDLAQPILQEMGFVCTFSCAEKVSVVTRDASSLFNLGRFNRASGLSAAEFMQRLQ